MCNLADDRLKIQNNFRVYSEADYQPGPALAAYGAKELEDRGIFCAYSHIAKGSVGIGYFMDGQMLSEFRKEGENRGIAGVDFLKCKDAEGKAAVYFQEKVREFFRDSAECFPDDDLSQKAVVWL